MRLKSVLAIGIVLACLATITEGQKKRHVNTIIEMLQSGKVMFGRYAPAKTAEGAKQSAALDAEILFYDLESGPLDFPQMSAFMTVFRQSGNFRDGMHERAFMVRIPAVHKDPVAAQKNTQEALNAGALSMMFPEVGSRAEAETAIRAMRYAAKGGTRGPGAGTAPAFWGISESAYRTRADVWPLNPEGELAATMLIESLDGLKNVRDIARTPGLTILLPGPGTLTNEVFNRDMVQVEDAIQKILAACKETKVPCGIASQPDTVEKRIKEGFQLIFANGPRAAETVAIGRRVVGGRP